MKARVVARDGARQLLTRVASPFVVDADLGGGVDAATLNEHLQGPRLRVETQASERKFVPRVGTVAFDRSLPMFCS